AKLLRENMKGDLIIEGSLLSQTDSDKTKYCVGEDVLPLLVQAYRCWNADGSQSLTAAACTMLLTDVCVEDKDDVPLKESSTAKMDLISREEEEMEYIGMSSEIPPPLPAPLACLSHPKGLAESVPPSRRVVLKRLKLEVEEDKGTGRCQNSP
ncbi:hypothetical protein ACHAWF_004872, partial [Thalassiosira exigua]